MAQGVGSRMIRSRYGAARRKTRDLVSVNDSGLSHAFDVTIMALIAANVLAVMLETVDPIYARSPEAFYAFELVSVTIFFVEYLARVWSATEIEEYNRPIVDRIHYAARPMLVIDLVAILPFFLGAFFPDLRFLRVLRLVRFFRLFKLARYSESMRSFGHVLRAKRADLTVALSATTILLILASSLMYYAERGAQPDVFSSIPASLWWGVVTLTTVGYGDTFPVTTLGRILGAVIALLGVGLVALPASILASGFIEEAASDDSRCPHCGELLDE